MIYKKKKRFRIFSALQVSIILSVSLYSTSLQKRINSSRTNYFCLIITWYDFNLCGLMQHCLGLFIHSWHKSCTWAQIEAFQVCKLSAVCTQFEDICKLRTQTWCHIVLFRWTSVSLSSTNFLFEHDTSHPTFIYSIMAVSSTLFNDQCMRATDSRFLSRESYLLN